MRLVVALIVITLLFISACSKQQPGCDAPMKLVGSSCCIDADNDNICDSSEPEPECPSSCDDDDSCTTDSCSAGTNFTCTNQKIAGCGADGYPIGIVSSNGYAGRSGQYVVLGEMQNIATYPLTKVIITAKFYGKKEEFLGSKPVSPDMPVIAAMQKLPFEIHFSNIGVDSYSLEATGYEQWYGGLYTGFVVIRNSSYISKDERFGVMGDIRNILNEPRGYVDIVGTFYGDDGNVVAKEYTYVNTEDSRPGRLFSFDMAVEPEASARIKSFTIQARARR